MKKLLKTIKEEWNGPNRGGWIIVLGIPLIGGAASMFDDLFLTVLTFIGVVVWGLTELIRYNTDI